MIEKASFDPSGDHTGPKQLSLGISFRTVTLPLERLATAMWRSGPGRVFASASVLNATRVPSGEISGSAPLAIFFWCVPSMSATKMFSRCSNAILRCAASENVKEAMQLRRKNVIRFILLKRADGWETRVFDQAFQVFSVSRHSIN